MVVSREDAFGSMTKPGPFLWAVVKPHFHAGWLCAERASNALPHSALLPCLRMCGKDESGGAFVQREEARWGVGRCGELLRVLQTGRISKNSDLDVALVELCVCICLCTCKCAGSFVCMCTRGNLYLSYFSSFHEGFFWSSGSNNAFVSRTHEILLTPD